MRCGISLSKQLHSIAVIDCVNADRTFGACVAPIANAPAWLPQRDLMLNGAGWWVSTMPGLRMNWFGTDWAMPVESGPTGTSDPITADEG